MNPSRKFAAVLVAILAGAAVAAFCLRAQTQGQISNPRQAQGSAALQMDRDLVVLDPAHGGQDAGATLGDKIFEKDVTLAIAARLRATLTAAGFSVVATRDSDSVDPNPMTSDQRAEIANRAHALACLVIHATASGPGVHLYTSALQPPEEDSSSNVPLTPRVAFVPVPWEQAQAASVSQSLRLAGDLSAALGKANLPVVSGREPVRPLDNLECPAVAIELSPLPVAGSDATPVTDAEYQQRVASTLTTALQAWRNQVDPTAPNSTATGAGGATNDPAAQAAVEARAAAEAAGRAAAKAHTPLGVPAGSQVRSQAGSHGATKKVKENSAGQAAPASSPTGSEDNPAPAEGSQ